MDFAACFEIFKYDVDYIIHGELSITRIDANGNEIWNFSGRDIFTEEFLIEEEVVKATNFYNDTYFLDINTGKIISETLDS